VPVEFIGQIHSLDPQRFENPSGGGFVSSSTQPIPEPAGLESLALGCLVALATTRRA